MMNVNKSEFLKELASGLDITLIVIDEDGKCAFCNWLLHEQLGEAPSSLEELIGLLADSPEKQKEFLSKFVDIQNNQKFALEFGKTDINGTTRQYLMKAATVTSVDSNSIAINISDISHQHNLFAEVEVLERQAAAGRIAAGVAHEFNNILTAMLGWTQLASKSAEDNPTTTISALETIENNTRRAKQIAADLMDIAKPKAGLDNLVSVNKAVNEALKLLAWDIKSAFITVNQDIGPTNLCRASSTRLVQVFINIIRNALDATPAKGSLDVTVKQTNDMVQAVFTDSGNGIPKEALAKIYEPFFSTKIKGANKNVQGGSGLGLSISKKILEDYGGSIEITSRRPGGTTVTINIPCSTDIEKNDSEPVQRQSSLPPGIAVLVVDDEADICEMIQTSLSLRGAHVVVSTNGMEALRLCETDNFDAAFLDFSMNGLSGHELATAISDIQPSLPIVFMSGVEVPTNPKRVHSDFLKKPFDLHEIQVKLREILERTE